MRRIRRNADERLRRLERSVAEGDPSSVEPLIRERLRSGLIKAPLLREAWWLSAPLTPPGTPRGPASPYNWHPLDWEENEITTPLDRLAQAQETLVIHDALARVLGEDVTQRWVGAFARASGLGHDEYEWPFSFDHAPRRVWAFSESNGFLIAGTGGTPNHSPVEIQADAAWDWGVGGTLGPWKRRLKIAAEAWGGSLKNLAATRLGVAAAKRRLVDSVDDETYSRWVTIRAMRGQRVPLEILKGLRYSSTVEYCAVLGAQNSWFGDEREQEGPGFGATEHRLVATLLGGPPL